VPTRGRPRLAPAIKSLQAAGDLIVHRDGDRVRLITKGGFDWSKRYPWIVEAALKNRQKQFVIDGEAVILGGLVTSMRGRAETSPV
jgi:hypothetical protein